MFSGYYQAVYQYIVVPSNCAEITMLIFLIKLTVNNLVNKSRIKTPGLWMHAQKPVDFIGQTHQKPHPKLPPQNVIQF